MSADEFWFGESRLTEAYREAHELKMEIVNQQLWLQGLYNSNAFSVVISNAFSKGQKQKYLEKPIEIRPEKVSPEKARQIVIDQLNAWKEAWDKRREEDGRTDRQP